MLLFALKYNNVLIVQVTKTGKGRSTATTYKLSPNYKEYLILGLCMTKCR